MNAADKELLAVIRYFTSNRTNIAKLLRKLQRDFDLDTVIAMTGLTVREQRELIDLLPKQKSKRLKQEAVAENYINDLGPSKKTQQTVKKLKLTNDEGEELPEDLSTIKAQRLAIHINGQSDLPQRVAYDMAMFIEKNLNPGDAWLSRKEALAKFECSSGTLSTANKILLDHNWIELVEPGNVRKGYVIK